MNPPIPPAPAPPTDFFNISTITLMISLVFLMQASAVGINSRLVSDYKGKKTFFFATLSLASAFVILLFQSVMPMFIAGSISNMLTLLGHLLMYVAVCRFTEQKTNRFLTFGILPLAYLAFVLLYFLPRGFMPIILVTLTGSIPLHIAAGWLLIKVKDPQYITAARLTALPLLFYAAFSTIRLGVGIINPLAVLPGQNISNIIDVLALFILSNLWTTGFILMISQRLQNKLTDLAMNDALTRVRNRRAMQGLLTFEMQRVRQEVKDFSIILLDIDHFKRVNDTYGHDAGDLVLHWMAQTLQNSVRVQDVVSRWGGEEFLILLPETNINDATELANRIRQTVQNGIVETPSQPIKITFSGGVASAKSKPDVDQLCKTADLALYKAKQTRNTIVNQNEL